MAGWYDDPLIPGGKRYWDGQRWTEAIQPPGPTDVPGPPRMAAAGGPPAPGGPPPYGPLPIAAPHPDEVGGDALNDIGEWLNRTFRALRDNALAVAALFFLVPLPFWAVSYLLADRLFGRARWIIRDARLEDVSTPLLVLTIAASVLAVIASLVGYLAGHHYLYRAHLGLARSLTGSLRVGFARQLRFAGIAVALAVIVLVVIAIPVVVFTSALVWVSGGLLGYVLLSVMLLVAAVILLIWLYVKMAFVAVSAVAVPAGTSALRASWLVSSGRFWPVLGRLAILAALGGVVSTVSQLVGQLLAPTVLLAKFEVSPGGNQLFINGRRWESIEVLQLSEALPHPLAGLFYLVALSATATVAQALSASALSALYGDAGGLVE